MKVNLQFDFQRCFGTTKVSSDLSPIEHDKKSGFAEISLPSYTKETKKTHIYYYEVDDSLPSETINIPSSLYGIDSASPTFDFCEFIPINEKVRSHPTTLEIATLCLDLTLYDKLTDLPSDKEKLIFLSVKFGIQHKKTVIYNGQCIAKQWCTVLNCQPQPYGIIDFSKTKIIFVKDNIKNTSNFINNKVNLSDIKIGCLTQPVPNELIIPTSNKQEDDTLFTFANHSILLKLNISSRSFIELSYKKRSIRVQLFVLLEPNNLSNNTIYVHPRVKALFPENDSVIINKYIPNEVLPIASSISIARVGGWYQSQKMYQGIILHNLKKFFTSKKRKLNVGDLIPITLDSSLASLFHDIIDPIFDDITLTDQNNVDTLVWFKVENANLINTQENGNDEINSEPIYTEFIIDPIKSKLITSSVVSVSPLCIINEDFNSYFDLEATFNYDPDVFDYYSEFAHIVESSIDRNKGIDIATSILLRSTSNNVGKSTLVDYICTKFNVHLLKIDCFSLTSNQGTIDSTAKIVGYIKAKIENVLPFTKSSMIYLSHLDILFPPIDPNQDLNSSKMSKTLEIELFNVIKSFLRDYENVLFVASVNEIDNLPNTIRPLFNFEINVPVPSEDQRNEMFEWYLSDQALNSGMNIGKDRILTKGMEVDLHKLAVHSAGLTPIDIRSIVQTARAEVISNSYNNTERTIEIQMKDLDVAIGQARDEFSVSIGAPKIPNVTWNDIGGVEQVKEEIMDTIDMPLKHPELFTSGMKKRSGLLFYGPPGTGKTLMAKAIATNFSLNFFSVKGPELLNMYIGESEANVRRVFQKAREAKPCVIFFDEIDSVAPKRGNQGDSGGVMDRIVSQLLAELDGMSSGSKKGSGSEGIFVIGATNRPDLLDEALLRPGRFDKLLYLGIPDNHEKQLNILKALTRKFCLDAKVDLSSIAKKCPFNYTGADFYALCSDAMLNAMTRISSTVDSKLEEYNNLRTTTQEDPVSLNYWFDQVATEDDLTVVVQMDDFIKAQTELVASVSHEELKHYLKVKQDFEK